MSRELRVVDELGSAVAGEPWRGGCAWRALSARRVTLNCPTALCDGDVRRLGERSPAKEDEYHT
jgi:hypothetical protein